MKSRIIEAYIGEYASGKSEIAINRSLELLATGEPVTLVDLDFVEPFYTLRPIKTFLEEQGLTVIGWENKDSFGLGETGGLIKPAARWVMWRTGHIIMDIGYGVHGAASLNLVENALESPELKVLAVINISRPITSSVEDIVDYVKSLGRVDGLVNNSHLGNETTAELVLEGLQRIGEASKILNIPLVFTVVAEEFKDLVIAANLADHEVRFIKRYMPGAMW